MWLVDRDLKHKILEFKEKIDRVVMAKIVFFSKKILDVISVHAPQAEFNENDFGNYFSDGRVSTEMSIGDSMIIGTNNSL